jgi:hypothetical protein
MEIIGTSVAAVTTLISVWLGSHLSKRRSESDWLREKRADLYLELLELLTHIRYTWAVGLKVSHIMTKSAIAAGHDFEGVEEGWRSQVDHLEHVELRIRMLGGKLTTIYMSSSNRLFMEMTEGLDNSSITEGEWDSLSRRLGRLIDELIEISRQDLQPTLFGRCNRKA